VVGEMVPDLVLVLVLEVADPEHRELVAGWRD